MDKVIKQPPLVKPSAKSQQSTLKSKSIKCEAKFAGDRLTKIKAARKKGLEIPEISCDNTVESLFGDD